MRRTPQSNLSLVFQLNNFLLLSHSQQQHLVSGSVFISRRRHCIEPYNIKRQSEGKERDRGPGTRNQVPRMVPRTRLPGYHSPRPAPRTTVAPVVADEMIVSRIGSSSKWTSRRNQTGTWNHKSWSLIFGTGTRTETTSLCLSFGTWVRTRAGNPTRPRTWHQCCLVAGRRAGDGAVVAGALLSERSVGSSGTVGTLLAGRSGRALVSHLSAVSLQW